MVTRYISITINFIFSQYFLLDLERIRIYFSISGNYPFSKDRLGGRYFNYN